MSDSVFSKGVALFAACFEDEEPPKGPLPEVLLIGACNSGKTLVARQLKSQHTTRCCTSNARQPTH